MRPIATDGVVWSVDLSVGRFVCLPCKTAEPTAMLLRMWTRVGQENYVLDRVQVSPRYGTFLREVMSGFSRMLSTSVPIGASSKFFDNLLLFANVA